MSEDKRFPIENLIDGHSDTFYSSSSIPTPYPWVQIELMDKTEVEYIKITNRRDCCGERLSNIEIRVGNNEMSSLGRSANFRNELCGRYDGPAENGEVVWVSCQKPLLGKFITIQTLDNSNVYMNIAEVEVTRDLPGTQHTYLKVILVFMIT